MDRTTFEALRDLPGKTISDDIQARLATHAIVSGVDQLRQGPIRIETTFLYPDGGSVDIFLVEDHDLSRALRLTDLGQTMSWLFDAQIKPWLSPKREGFIDDVLRLYRVEQDGGQLVLRLANLDELVPGLVSLGQTCIRVADLVFTKRSAMVAAFTEQVEEVLTDVEIPYEQNAELEGRYGNLVRGDFLAEGRSTTEPTSTSQKTSGVCRTSPSSSPSPIVKRCATSSPRSRQV